MTTIAARLAVPLTASAIGGALLGVADLQAQQHIPYPWAELANSAAVWALAAYVVGLVLRPHAGRAVAAATLLLLVAVAVYYGAAAVLLGDDIGVLWSQTGRMWFVAALVAGPVFGGAGAVSVPAAGRAFALAAPLVPALTFLGEALLDLRRVGDPGYDAADQWQLVVVKTAVGVAVPIAVWAAGARHRSGQCDAGDGGSRSLPGRVAGG